VDDADQVDVRGEYLLAAPVAAWAHDSCRSVKHRDELVAADSDPIASAHNHTTRDVGAAFIGFGAHEHGAAIVSDDTRRLDVVAVLGE